MYSPNQQSLSKSKKTFYLDNILPLSETLYSKLFKDFINTKSYSLSTLQHFGIVQAVAVVKSKEQKESTTSYPIIGIKMGDNSYHCCSYTTYTQEFRFLNAAADKKHKPQLHLLGDPSTHTFFLTEGFWDMLTGHEMGYQFCALPGANNFQEDWLELFTEKVVYLCFDNDKPGKKFAEQWARKISAVAAAVYVITLPELVTVGKIEHPIKDLSDLYNLPKDKDHKLCHEVFSSLIEEAEPVTITAKDRIDDMMNSPRLTVVQKYNTIASFIQENIEGTAGRLIPYNDRQELAIVLDGKHVLIDKYLNLHLKEQYGCLSSVTLWKHAQDQLHQLSLQYASAKVSMYSHYEDGCCYIGTEKQGLIKVSPEAITTHLQGENDIFVRTDNNIDIGCLSPSASQRGTTLESLLDLFLYDDAGGSPEAQKFLLKTWLYHSFFDPQMRVILCATGEPGSGKTLLLKILKGVLFGFTGGRYNPNSIPDEDYVFTEMVKASRYIFLDEVNESEAAMKTKLRMLATGGVSTFRPKYAKDSISFHPKVWLALSSHSPKFRENDIAQRLCIIRLAHPSGKTKLINESQFLEGLEGKRTEIWYHLLSELSTILSNLKKYKKDQIQLKNYCRQVEMAEFAWQAFPEERELCLKTFESLNAIQEGFSAEFDPNMDLVDAWMAQHSKQYFMDGKVKVSVREMFPEMSALAKEAGIKFFPASKAGFGKWIHSRCAVLFSKYGYERSKNYATNSWEYVFDKPKVDPGAKEVF